MSDNRVPKYKSPRDFDENPQVPVKPSMAEALAAYKANLEEQILNGEVPEPVEDGDETPIMQRADAPQEPQQPVNQFAQTLEKAEERYKNLQRFARTKEVEAATQKERADKLDGEVGALREQLRTMGTNQMVLPETAEDLEDWRYRNPDLFNMLKAVMAAEAETTIGQLQARVAELEGTAQSLNHSLTETKRMTAEQLLDKDHPDWRELPQSPKFIEWAKAQPAFVKNILEHSNDFTEVGWVISQYKASGGYRKAATRTSLPDREPSDVTSAAFDVRQPATRPNIGDSKKVWLASEIKKMKPEEYDAVHDEVMAAYAEGRYQDDVGNMG